MFGLIVILASGFAALVHFVGIYNGLVGLRERVQAAWANIDVLLEPRHERDSGARVSAGSRLIEYRR